MKKRILLFKASSMPSNRLSHDGVFQHARKEGWNVQMIEYPLAREKRRMNDDVESVNVEWLIDFWRPDGVIIDCSGQMPPPDLATFGAIPVVFLDCHPEQAGQDADCVYSDAVSIARIAARELMSPGVDNFAFVPFFEDVTWSHQRRDEFAKIARLNNKRFHLLENISSPKSVQTLAEQLKRLPRPCGVMAANDEVARLVLTACEASEVDVPGDLAVIGVDNDVNFCENASVTLSSIEVDYFASGRLAARLLDDRLANPTASAATVAFGAQALVRRASTRRVLDRRIAAALERIRLEACARITPTEVARSMGVSRRLADILFASAVGHSVFEEIRTVRIARVKEMLANPRQELSAIPDICGYRTLAELCRDFRRATGMTLNDWRKRGNICK
ncbi:MAG: substrate-binding domain-containing protein [Kiritimatiellia bacterium]|jgi:LacI family transcriptional regulator